MAYDLLDRSTMSISRKILAIILIISSVVTTLVTVLQLSFDYVQDVNAIRNNLSLIEKSYTPSISASVWNMDVHQLQSQLDGIISIPGILHVQFFNEQNKAIAEAGKLVADSVITNTYKISWNNMGEIVFLGNLVVSANLGEVYNRIFNKVMVIFLTQFAKTLLVSTLIYLSIQRMLTRHLIDISKYLQSMDLGTAARVLQLKRKIHPKQRDELEVLVSSINQMRFKVDQSYSQLNALNEQLENKVQQKTHMILEQRQKLEYSAKMSALGEMAGGMAHEINTPLTTAQLNTYMLLKRSTEQKLTPDVLQATLEGMKRTLDRIAIVVQGLRQFSKDGVKDELMITNVKSVVEQSVNLCQEKILNLGIRLTMEGPDIDAFCNSSDLSQVVFSLILNARDAVLQCEEKWIHIEWNWEDQDIVIAITDSGPGISDEIREKIFQPFFTTKEVNKGAGLGLSIAKGLIEGQNGKLELDPTSKRTRFLVRLRTPFSSRVA